MHINRSPSNKVFFLQSFGYICLILCTKPFWVEAIAVRIVILHAKVKDIFALKLLFIFEFLLTNINLHYENNLTLTC